MARGYVYALINPSIPDAIKIGVSEDHPDISAAELTRTTGVANPFIAAYHKYFEDCETAETFVYASLQSKGISVSRHSEFIKAPLNDVIAAISQTPGQIESNGTDGNDINGGASPEPEELPEPSQEPTVAQPKKMATKNKVAIGIVAIIGLFMVLGSFTDPEPRVTSTQRTNSSSTDSLDTMVIAFQGNYSRAVIKRELSRAMVGHDVALTNENYSRAGSVLVAMRKESGIPEMQILRCINSSGYQANMSFPDITAICVTLMEAIKAQ